MKTKILILSILICFSCCKKADILEKKEENEIIGKWQMCKSVYKQTEVAYNTCLTVTFLFNQTGFIETNDNKKHEFTYLKNKDIINFKFASKGDLERFFINISEFDYKIDKKQNLITLKLIHGDYKWILTR